jgi:hypothetical protein
MQTVLPKQGLDEQGNCVLSSILHFEPVIPLNTKIMITVNLKLIFFSTHSIAMTDKYGLIEHLTLAESALGVATVAVRLGEDRTARDAWYVKQTSGHAQSRHLVIVKHTDFTVPASLHRARVLVVQLGLQRKLATVC